MLLDLQLKTPPRFCPGEVDRRWNSEQEVAPAWYGGTETLIGTIVLSSTSIISARRRSKTIIELCTFSLPCFLRCCSFFTSENEWLLQYLGSGRTRYRTTPYHTTPAHYQKRQSSKMLQTKLVRCCASGPLFFCSQTVCSDVGAMSYHQTTMLAASTTLPPSTTRHSLQRNSRFG